MTYKSVESNSWNPFIPTERDIQRTEQLANKNYWIAGILTYIFVPLGSIYLNRGINSLKILGYVFAIAFSMGISASSEEEAYKMGKIAGVLGNVVIVVEQVRSISEARKRTMAKKDLI